jgi:hypothetical protein
MVRLPYADRSSDSAPPPQQCGDRRELVGNAATAAAALKAGFAARVIIVRLPYSLYASHLRPTHSSPSVPAPTKA